MRARYLCLSTVASIVVAVWGCGFAAEGGLADATGGSVDDLRVAPRPRSANSTESGAGGTATSSTATQSGLGAGGGADMNSCEYPALGEIHLPPPDERPFASPALARGLVKSGRAPLASDVRTRDFLNYYETKYPDQGTRIGVFVEVAPSAVANEAILQIAFQAASEPHRPLALAVVIDTSLSMAGESMKRARSAVNALVGALRIGDIITVSTSSGSTVVEQRRIGSGDDRNQVAARVAAVEADGGEFLGAAVNDAYLAVRAPNSGADLMRVVLVTDGAASPEVIDRSIVAGGYQIAEIPLIAVGVGDALSYDTAFVEGVASVGGGTTIYLDSAEEAQRLLGDRFDQIMEVAAKNLEVTLELPDDLRLQRVEESGASESPTGLARTDLGPGRTLIYRYVLESCKPISKFSSTATLRVTARYQERDSGQFVPKVTVAATLDKLGFAAPPSAHVMKASFVADFADGLRNLRTAQLATIAKSIRGLQADINSDGALRDDADLDEIASLAEAFVTAASSAP